jgi:hypothetical protein
MKANGELLLTVLFDPPTIPAKWDRGRIEFRWPPPRKPAITEASILLFVPLIITDRVDELELTFPITPKVCALDISGELTTLRTASKKKRV